jgi:GNAT superfamily N-acetyltransferase
MVVDGDREGALSGVLANHVLLQDVVNLTRLGQVLEFDRAGGRRQLLIDDLVAEVNALVADIDARTCDQLLDLALRLAAEAAEELLVRVCRPCQRNPLLGAVVCLPARVPKLKGSIKPALSVRSFTAWSAPSLPVIANNQARLAYRADVEPKTRIEPVSKAQLERLLPLIAAYQRFYEVEEIDDERNRTFFARFIAPRDDGLLLGAWRADDLLGYACLYWHFTSLLPAETVLMNDLFVTPDARGLGVGRALIEASAEVARSRGAHHLEWATAPDNATAQRLYDATGAKRSTWIEYELDV